MVPHRPVGPNPLEEEFACFSWSRTDLAVPNSLERERLNSTRSCPSLCTLSPAGSRTGVPVPRRRLGVPVLVGHPIHQYPIQAAGNPIQPHFNIPSRRLEIQPQSAARLVKRQRQRQRHGAGGSSGTAASSWRQVALPLPAVGCQIYHGKQWRWRRRRESSSGGHSRGRADRGASRGESRGA